MEAIKILTVQAKLHWEAPNKNREHLASLIASNSSDCDLIVLPEMFTTGFSMRPELFAEVMSDEMKSLTWMRNIAAQRSCAITGTLAVSDRGAFYNRIFWVDASGAYQTADKRHLFTLGKEHEHYSAGDKKLIAEIKGWKVNPMCCYDLRFPVWCRNGVREGQPEYDLQIFMANWPDKRIAHWDTLLPARAIENQSVVVGVNIVGTDAQGVAHSGHSASYNAMGEKLGEHPFGEEGVLLHEISREELEKTRRSLSFLKDGDGFEIR